MQLSYRLETIANMVSKGSRVADIGCDHAYVSIYLILNQIASRVIAMDANKGPLSKAIENISTYHLIDSIETRLSDGGQSLQPKEVDTILIAGMGGALMVKILSESKEVVSYLDELVLQPQSEIFLVRQYITKIGYYIVEENMLVEDKKYYVMIKAKNGTGSLFLRDKNPDFATLENKTPVEVYNLFGKKLLEKKDPVLKQYLLTGLEVNTTLIEQLSKSDSPKTRNRINQLKIDIDYIKKGLCYYEM